MAEEIPQLTTYPAADEADQIASLKLIADSVAQQRQLAARSVIFHPVSVGVAMVPLAVAYRILYKTRGDWPLILTTWAGCVMALLLAVRYLTGGYIDEAERVGTWKWLNTATTTATDTGAGFDSTKSTMLVTKFGENIIGTLVLAEQKKQTGVIRAWTVKQRYRGKGVGRDLLEEAVKFCRDKGWEGPVFDDEHANSARVLPGMFNGGFDGGEKRAREMLAGLQST
ncbi:hypothetical protein ASPZODRAFT_126528 [Penicilliopsis zonata CBS 506.65]|uniref:N-acetyltransferase domain-containing protein n=1 Tax=Penicilliopsis zonata CBS 506.65 TaxID=1073090 RepID=A0A1L9STU4_9EURO|nr:hypothetical protein ASPZODRAFT_126528 [Penicilliopsis zonata CBS 506.65]OJJ50630.1 hypothetical protein ASPZODRAFT_126528 [Penicilliopsis zonata CBS 506.65]